MDAPSSGVIHVNSQPVTVALTKSMVPADREARVQIQGSSVTSSNSRATSSFVSNNVTGSAATYALAQMESVHLDKSTGHNTVNNKKLDETGVINIQPLECSRVDCSDLVMDDKTEESDFQSDATGHGLQKATIQGQAIDGQIMGSDTEMGNDKQRVDGDKPGVNYDKQAVDYDKPSMDGDKQGLDDDKPSVDDSKQDLEAVTDQMDSKKVVSNSEVHDKQQGTCIPRVAVTVLDYKIICPHCNFLDNTISKFVLHLSKAHRSKAKVCYVLSRSDKMYAFCPCCAFVTPSKEYEKMKLHVLSSHMDDNAFVKLIECLAKGSIQEEDFITTIWKRAFSAAVVILKIPNNESVDVKNPHGRPRCQLSQMEKPGVTKTLYGLHGEFVNDQGKQVTPVGNKPMSINDQTKQVTPLRNKAPLIKNRKKKAAFVSNKPSVQRVVIPKSSVADKQPADAKETTRIHETGKLDSTLTGQNSLSEEALTGPNVKNGLPSEQWLNLHHPDSTLSRTYLSHLDKCLITINVGNVPQGMTEVHYKDLYVMEESGGLRCEICSETVPSQPPLTAEEHISQHYQLRIWSCVFCLIKRPTRYKIIKHMLEVHPTLPMIVVRDKPATQYGRTKELRHADIVMMEHWYPGAHVQQVVEPTGEVTFTVHVEKEKEPPDNFSILDHLTPRKSPVCVCKLCGTIFLKAYINAPKVPNIISHIYSHFQIKTWSCLYCEWDRNAKCSREQLLVHLRIAHPDQPFILVRDTSFSPTSHSKVHPQGSSQSARPISRKSHRVMANRFKLLGKYGFMDAVRRKLPRYIYTCSICRRQFTSHKQLLHHVSLVHPDVSYDSSMSQRKRRIPPDYNTEMENILKGNKNLKLCLPRVPVPKTVSESGFSTTTEPRKGMLSDIEGEYRVRLSEEGMANGRDSDEDVELEFEFDFEETPRPQRQDNNEEAGAVLAPTATVQDRGSPKQTTNADQSHQEISAGEMDMNIVKPVSLVGPGEEAVVEEAKAN